MSGLAELAGGTIGTIAAALRKGSVSAEALLNHCLDLIARHEGGEGGLHAILSLAPDARAAARACDAEMRAGRSRGALHGVPIIVKDNIDVAGLPTTSGNPALAHAMPRCDAALVARLRQAGALIVGKANMSEFSFEIRSRSSLGGDVRNPFLRHVTAGGSSGGTAAAVSAGFAVAGLGTDTGGSIRVPAAYTGLVGLRPTHGRLDMGGVAPLAPTTDTIGPIARSVDDAALLFELLGGRTAGDAASGGRIGVLRQAFGSSAEIKRAAYAAIGALEKAGLEIVDAVDLPDDLLAFGGTHIVDLEFAGAFDEYLATNFGGDRAAPSLEAILEAGDHLPDYADAMRRRLELRSAPPAVRAAVLGEHERLRAALGRVLAEHRLCAFIHPTSMVLPTSLALPAGGWAPELAARSGWPALSVPAGLSSDGLPIGVELLAPADREGVLFTLGRAIERAIGPRARPRLI